jgi:hypothetical protein
MSNSNQPSRRHFLKTAAAVAAPMVVPATVLGRDGVAAPSERMTLGCIGVGNRGTGNLNHFLSEPRTQVLAVCDVDRTHRERARELAGLDVNSAYIHFQDVINRDDIDVVSIGTPDHWHAINTIAAANAGKDIFCEKPVSLTIAEGRKMVDAVKANDTILQVGTWRRSIGECRHACELVRNGYVGELHTIEAVVPEGHAIRGEIDPAHPEMPVPDGFDYDLWLGPAPEKPYTPGRCHFNFRWILDYSAGFITDWGAHYYDVAQWGNNSDDTGPVTISGAAEFPREGLYDASIKHLITYTYATGVRLVAYTGKGGGVKFIGSEGWLHVESNKVTSEPASIAETVLKDTDKRLESPLGNHIYNFVDSVFTRETPAAPIEVGHRSASICHLGHIATTLKRELHWDPAKEEFINDAEANLLRDRPGRGPWQL